MRRLRPGAVVIRRHRLLKTLGTVLRFDGEDKHGSSRAWIKWDHPTTLPNPSLESVDDVEEVVDSTVVYYVSCLGDESWAVRRDGADAEAVFTDQHDAVRYATERARLAKSGQIVVREKGQPA
jgi:hypothetical protein